MDSTARNGRNYVMSPESLISITSIKSFAYDSHNIAEDLDYVARQLDGTPECNLNDDLADPDDFIDEAIQTLRLRGLEYTEIDKAR
jgi:hypothetical protein